MPLFLCVFFFWMFVVLVLQIFANTMVMRNALWGSLTPCPWFCTGNVERTWE